MIELPEASSLALQLNTAVRGKKVRNVISGHTAHKMVWYFGDRARYPDLLVGTRIEKASACGSMVEIKAGAANVLLSEGVAVRFHGAGEPRPTRHQLLIEFEDESALSASVQMYGGMGCFPEGELDNLYYRVARQKPSPLTGKFNDRYFGTIVSAADLQNLSLKALLATEQRIPGLGNGTLQDILFNAGLHPKRKTKTLSEEDRARLYKSVKTTMTAMADRGGRDTEIDLFGKPGGYRTILSKKTVSKPCSVCGTPIQKETYMGGAIYYCGQCQI